MEASNIIITHTLNTADATYSPNEPINVTRGMVRVRAVELAATNGRKPHEASKSDWEDAKRQLSGVI